MNSAPAWRLRDVLAAAALFLASAAFTLWQNTHVAAMFDLSYLLDSGYRMSLGQVPFRDYPFVHAPLTFLLHGLIIKIFGRVYLPHIICGALEGGAGTVLSWRLLLALLKPLGERAWVLGTALATPLVMLGIYGVYPHPIYDSDSIMAVLVALFLLQRAGDGTLRNALAGAACVMPLFFKQNIGLPFLLTTVMALLAVAFARRLQRVNISPQLWCLGGILATSILALVLIEATAGLHNYYYWTITFAAQRRLPGLGTLLEIYSQNSLLWMTGTALVAVALLRIDRFSSKKWSRPTAYVLLAAPFLRTIVALAQTSYADERADRLLMLWPYLLVLAGIFAVANLRPSVWKAEPAFDALLPIILLAAIHGTLLSQQLWGSTYAIWPLLLLLIAMLLTQVPTIAQPLAWTIAATFLLCGSLYATSHERLSYIHLDGAEAHATLPELKGMTTPGPWIPEFEELIHFTDAEIPAGDGILLFPGEDPFYFVTGRTPQFPILLFDVSTTDPYTPQQTLEETRSHNIRWVIVKRDLQLMSSPATGSQEILRDLQQDFALYRSIANYDIYRRK